MSSPAKVATTPGNDRTKPLRADARRNRASVLEAARAAFADAGLDAQMDDVAARSGLGVGTVYRHFPTKDALVEALVEERFLELERIAAEELERDDPWEAFSGFVWGAAELQATDRALTEIVAARPGVMAEIGQRHVTLELSVTELIDRAQAAGALRADVTFRDVPMLMCGVGRVIQQTEGDDRWRRFVSIVLDGLSTGAHTTPLPPG